MVSLREMIENRIASLEDGTVFVPADFFDITAPVNVNNILARMNREGIIRRCMRGVYAKPYFSKALDTELIPKADDVLLAIARRNRWDIAPCGQTALNRIGLSTQIPAVLEYVTSGPDKVYEYDGFTMRLRHRANRDMIGYSPVTRVFIQAMKALGKDSVGDITVRALSEKLTREQAVTIYDETRNTTAWISDIAKQLKETIT